MMGNAGILNGSNDEAALSSLYGALGQPQNRSQELFVRAWELSYGVEELAAVTKGKWANGTGSRRHRGDSIVH
jgi:hypothetical protein